MAVNDFYIDRLNNILGAIALAPSTHESEKIKYNINVMLADPTSYSNDQALVLVNRYTAASTNKKTTSPASLLSDVESTPGTETVTQTTSEQDTSQNDTINNAITNFNVKPSTIKPEDDSLVSDTSPNPSEDDIVNEESRGEGTNNGGDSDSSGTSESQTTTTPNASTQSPSSSGSDSSSSSSTSKTTCGGISYLNKTIKPLRTFDKSLWFWWIDSVVGKTNASSSPSDFGGISGQSSTFVTSQSSSGSFASSSKFQIIDVQTGSSYMTKELEDLDSVLFYSRTITENLNLPKSVNAKLDVNCFWAIYLEDNVYKPIKNVKYFDFWYDDDSLNLDLVFWSNIDVTGSGLYDNTIDSYNGDDINENAHRAVFYSQGVLSEVNVVRAKKTYPTRMFIFSKPSVLLVPGVSAGSDADPVVDRLAGINFLEYK